VRRMTTLIALAEEDSSMHLIELVGEVVSRKTSDQSKDNKDNKESKQQVQNLIKTLTKLAAQSDYAHLMQQALLTSPSPIAVASEPELESLVSLALTILDKVNEESKQLDLLKRLSVVLTQTSNNATLRLSLLTTLYNWLNNVSNEDVNGKLTSKVSSVGQDLITIMLKYAVDTNHAASIAPQIKLIDSWMADWKLQPLDSYEMYLLLSHVCKAANQTAEWHKYLLKSLSALDKAKKEALESAKPHAHAAVVSALASSSIMQFDSLLGLSAVKQLADDKKYGATHHLLRIFTYDTVDSFIKFTNDNKIYIESLGLDYEELLRKIRTLTICSLALDKDRLSYNLLKETLQCADSSAVESCIIDAVTSGCVEAKIDQGNEEVVIIRSMRRVFDSNSWALLATQLSAWRKNLHSILNSLHQLQSRQQSSGANSFKE